tara:strand:- start:116 stop:349 length:234 start_codon:yes stop_codon:yes gene_type:complete
MSNVHSDKTDAKYLDATECGTCGETLDYERDELAEVAEVISINGNRTVGRTITVEYSVMHSDCALNEMRTNANLSLA